MWKQSNSGRTGLGVALLLFTACFILGGIAGRYLEFDKTVWQNITAVRKKADPAILLIGVDARNKNEPSRSDTIIVAFLHPRQNRIDLLSIPRDTRVKIEGQEYKRKINFAHAKGGPELLSRTLQEEFDIKVDGYIEVDFEGFEKVIDSLGGVDINVEKRMYYPEECIDLYPGQQRLNGHDALAYVRYRSDGLGDIGRIQRQQKFLRAAARQLMQAKNIIKSPGLVNEVMAAVRTDLNTKELLTIASQFAGQLDIQTYTVPGESGMINGGSYWLPDWNKTRELVQHLKTGESNEDRSAGETSSG